MFQDFGVQVRLFKKGDDNLGGSAVLSRRVMILVIPVWSESEESLRMCLESTSLVRS